MEAIILKCIFKIIYRILFFIVAYCLIQIPTLAEVIWRNETKANLHIWEHWGLFIPSSLILLSLMFYSLYKFSNMSFPTTKVTRKGLILATVATIISQLGQYLISILNGGDKADYDIMDALNSPIFMITILSVIVISPILEEILYQGIIQNVFFKNMNPYINILITAFIFALSHGYSFSLLTLELFVSGLAYAFVFYKTKDLKMAIYSHSLANVIAMLTNFI